MKRLLHIVASALLPATLAAAAPSSTAISDYLSRYSGNFAFAHKAAYKSPFETDAKLDALNNRISRFTKSKSKATAAPDKTSLPLSDEFGYLDAPDGSTWFYTAKYDAERIAQGDESYTYYITNIKGYTYTIYDSKFNVVGTVKDVINLVGDETRVAQLQLDACVTKRFFNSDNNYEVMVSLIMNRDMSANPYPYTTAHTKAYSIGGAKDDDGNDVAIANIDGYVVSTLNVAPDAWSENFYITFMTEEGNMDLPTIEEMLESCSYTLKTYKKGGYNTPPVEINTSTFSLPRLPGNQETTPFFMAFEHDGKPYFVAQRYDKWFMTDPVGFTEDESMNPDNSLIIDIYTLNSLYDSEFTHVQTTRVPMSLEGEPAKVIYKYYCVGSLAGEEDFIFNGDKIDFMLTNETLSTEGGETTLYAYHNLSADGVITSTIATDVDGQIRLSDIKGEPGQHLFIINENSSTLSFKFINVPSGEVVLSTPIFIDHIGLTAQLDRYPSGGSYKYAIRVSSPYTEADGSTVEQVVWINTDGTIDHIDNLNLGQDVALAQPYIDASALSPFCFNTDNEREYMYLVKRYINAAAGSTETNEELVVVSTSGETLLTIAPDMKMGNLASIALVNLDSDPNLMALYSNDDYKVTQVFYPLPLSKFNGGDGTAENPYLIATAGDLMQMGKNVNAHYRLVNDIDADHAVIPSVKDSFSGSLDGNGKTISNIAFEGYGLFSALGVNASVKDLNLVNVSIDPKSTLRSGVIAGSALMSKIDNVHIYGLTARSDIFEDSFGSLIGLATNNTAITNCSVTTAEIDIPEAMVGGIVGSTRTGATINACSFMGSINGGVEVGGIVGEVDKDETIADCHVDADIKARNTVGGIIGLSGRAHVTRCYFEGSIEATENNARFHNTGANAGGIIGSLETYYVEVENPTPIVDNCFVNIRSLKTFTPATPTYDGQFDSVHRIIGRTSVNEELTEPDQEPFAPEAFIANNYATSTLDRVDQNIEAAHNTTEGADVDPDDLSAKWFKETLGFATGTSVESPWHELSDHDPYLHHEKITYAAPAEINTNVGELFNATFVIIHRTPVNETDLLDGLVLESDESIAEMTGNYSVKGNVFAIEFKAVAEGSTSIVYSDPASYAKVECKVNVAAPASVGSIGADSDAPAIAVNGTTVSATGCQLSLYSVSGALVARGTDTLSASAVAPGVYVATAVDAAGRRSTVKLIVK